MALTSPTTHALRHNGTFDTVNLHWHIGIFLTKCQNFKTVFFFGCEALWIWTCVWMRPIHHNAYTGLFRRSPSTLPFCGRPSLTPNPLATTSVFCITIALPFQRCYIDRITVYRNFGDWIPLCVIIPLRFTQGFHISHLFLFITKEWVFQCVDAPRSILCGPIEEHLSHFETGAMMNRTAINIFCMNMFSFL